MPSSIEPTTHSAPRVLGRPLDRIDGRQKVTGRALYAADHPIAGVAYAYGIMSPIANGRIQSIDTRAAEHVPGVLAVLHHGNVSRLQRCPDAMGQDLKTSELRPPFEDDRVYYAGQFVALVVAETFAQARWASHLVNVTYSADQPVLTLDAGATAHGAKLEKDESSARGDAAGAFATAPVQLDETYTTPAEVHNAMEMHATLARWENDRLIVDDSTQWVVGQAKSLAHVIGIPAENVELHAPFIGGGFGSKLFLWPHAILAAVAARHVRRPVKLVLTRQQQFTTAGHRPETRQRIRLGANPDGRLTAILHESTSHTSLVTDFVENCGQATPSLYECPNVTVTQHTVRVNVGSPTSMRAPGAACGLYALEAAMDELAIRLKLDPVELRRRNLPDRDPGRDVPWSSNHLRECLRVATERFGWGRRNPMPGSMRDGRDTLGWGFAVASWPAHRKGASARLEFRPDGSARAVCATQDIGTGTYTVIAQVVSQITSLPFSRIDVAIGNSTFPPGPISGGSMATASVVPAIAGAAREAVRNLFAAATAPGGPWAGTDPASLSLQDGSLADSSGRRMPLHEVLGRLRSAPISGEVHAEPGAEAKKFSFRSFGAVCAEVRWDPGISRLRVSRIVGAYDTGQVINAKTARNQIEGALVMGLGMALLERAEYDQRTGRVVNDNFADYLVASQADTPQLDVTFLNQPDPHIGDFGAKGLGEIGITGIPAAILNAIHHATGQRYRAVPVTIEKLMA
ncbi:MAG TPA: xanthine dehydrogenase family protein molybdopterin-binding subunit [Opitutaceae bacterium]|nr:xanthine dehydrogenase family protein molybdopterin-binding subunit [Opitutaceae bacterium]